MCRQAGIELPQSDDTAILAQPVKIGSLTTPNRLAALPMEGCDALPDGAPGELTFRRYGRMAAGGTGLIWLEACAVTPEGRSKPSALYLQPANLDSFRRLVDHMRREARRTMGQEIICVLQLTHAGRYCRPAGAPVPVVAHRNPVLDATEKIPNDHPLITDDELGALMEDFVGCAALAAAAGFDGVDVKACHGYLVSSLLGAHLRPGRYGGSYENRTRFLRETVARIRRESPGLLVTTRLNVFDGMPHSYGFGTSSDGSGRHDLREPLRLVAELAAEGMPLIAVSLGFPRTTPHYGRPSADGRMEHPLAGIARYAGMVGEVQRAVPEVAVVNGGLAWLGGQIPRVAAGLVASGGTTLIGQGRNSIAYPDMPRDLVAGRGFDPREGCLACSGCSRLMRAGHPVGCVVRDRKIYAAV